MFLFPFSLFFSCIVLPNGVTSFRATFFIWFVAVFSFPSRKSVLRTTHAFNVLFTLFSLPFVSRLALFSFDSLLAQSKKCRIDLLVCCFCSANRHRIRAMPIVDWWLCFGLVCVCFIKNCNFQRELDSGLLRKTCVFCVFGFSFDKFTARTGCVFVWIHGIVVVLIVSLFTEA